MTFWDKLVADYAGVSLLAVGKLDYIDYLILKRDAFIYKMSRTKEGQEYLNKAWGLTQTSPDRKKLREQFGEEQLTNGKQNG